MTQNPADIMEVDDADHAKFGLPQGWYTVFRNGQPVHHYPTFEQAMRHAYPGWQPSGETCETRGDNLGLSAG